MAQGRMVERVKPLQRSTRPEATAKFSQLAAPVAVAAVRAAELGATDNQTPQAGLLRVEQVARLQGRTEKPEVVISSAVALEPAAAAAGQVVPME